MAQGTPTTTLASHGPFEMLERQIPSTWHAPPTLARIVGRERGTRGKYILLLLAWQPSRQDHYSIGCLAADTLVPALLATSSHHPRIHSSRLVLRPNCKCKCKCGLYFRYARQVKPC